MLQRLQSGDFKQHSQTDTSIAGRHFVGNILYAANSTKHDSVNVGNYSLILWTVWSSEYNLE